MTEEVWRQTSNADVSFSYVYLTDKGVEHIAAQHADLAQDPEKVRRAISETTRVLRAKADHASGVGYKRLRFVNDNVRTSSGKAVLTAIVEREADGSGKVVTATWKGLSSLKGSHLWESESGLLAHYDAEGDVAYISRGTSRQNYSDDDPDEPRIWLRRADDNDAPVGVTVFDYRELWESDADGLATRIATFLSAPAGDVKSRLSGLLTF